MPPDEEPAAPVEVEVDLDEPIVPPIPAEAEREVRLTPA